MPKCKMYPIALGAPAVRGHRRPRRNGRSIRVRRSSLAPRRMSSGRAFRRSRPSHPTHSPGRALQRDRCLDQCEVGKALWKGAEELTSSRIGLLRLGADVVLQSYEVVHEDCRFVLATLPGERFDQPEGAGE